MGFLSWKEKANLEKYERGAEYRKAKKEVHERYKEKKDQTPDRRKKVGKTIGKFLWG